MCSGANTGPSTACQSHSQTHSSASQHWPLRYVTPITRSHQWNQSQPSISAWSFSSVALGLLAPTRISKIHMTEVFTLSRFAFIREKEKHFAWPFRVNRKTVSSSSIHHAMPKQTTFFMVCLFLSCMSLETLSVSHIKSSSSKQVTQRSEIMTYCYLLHSMSACPSPVEIKCKRVCVSFVALKKKQ